MLEEVVIDVDHLHLSPKPYRFVVGKDLLSSTHDTFHQGYSLIVDDVDPRDLHGGHLDVLLDDAQALVPPFDFKSWVDGNNKWCLQVPLMDWAARGNDDNMVRVKYGSDDALYGPLIKGCEERRKELSLVNDGSRHDGIPKVVEFTFISSSNPRRVFTLDGDALALNSGCEGLKQLDISYNTFVHLDQQTFQHGLCQLSFRVADTEQPTRQV